MIAIPASGDGSAELEQFKKDGFKEVLVVLMRGHDCVSLCRLDEAPIDQSYNECAILIASAAMSVTEGISKPGSNGAMAKLVLADAIRLIDLNPQTASVETSELKREP
jgi:hypothetical protein